MLSKPHTSLTLKLNWPVKRFVNQSSSMTRTYCYSTSRVSYDMKFYHIHSNVLCATGMKLAFDRNSIEMAQWIGWENEVSRLCRWHSISQGLVWCPIRNDINTHLWWILLVRQWSPETILVASHDDDELQNQSTAVTPQQPTRDLIQLIELKQR